LGFPGEPVFFGSGSSGLNDWDEDSRREVFGKVFRGWKGDAFIKVLLFFLFLRYVNFQAGI